MNSFWKNSGNFCLVDLYGLHESALDKEEPIKMLFPKDGRLGVVLRIK